MNEKKIFPILINRNIEAPKYIQAYYIIIRLKNVSISDLNNIFDDSSKCWGYRNPYILFFRYLNYYTHGEDLSKYGK